MEKKFTEAEEKIFKARMDSIDLERTEYILQRLQSSIKCMEWMREYASTYDSNKDLRIMHEVKENGVKSYHIGSDDPRYKEVKQDVFVENYRRCLSILEEMDLLVKQMIHAGYISKNK